MNNKDKIDWTLNRINPKLIDFLFSKELKAQSSITVFFNSKPVKLEKPLLDVYRENKLLHLNDELLNNDQLTLIYREAQPFILQDIFLVVDIPIDSLSGKQLIINKNGDKATFSTPLHNGDKIELAIN